MTNAKRKQFFLLEQGIKMADSGFIASDNRQPWSTHLGLFSPFIKSQMGQPRLSLAMKCRSATLSFCSIKKKLFFLVLMTSQLVILQWDRNPLRKSDSSHKYKSKIFGFKSGFKLSSIRALPVLESFWLTRQYHRNLQSGQQSLNNLCIQIFQGFQFLWACKNEYFCTNIFFWLFESSFFFQAAFTKSHEKLDVSNSKKIPSLLQEMKRMNVCSPKI